MVQIKIADGGAYEAYLQEYPEYTEAAGTDAEANREIKEEAKSSTSSSWTRYMAPAAVLLAGGVSLAAGRRKRGEGRK